MRVYQLILLFIVVLATIPIALHHHVHGVLDPDQMAVSFFLVVNLVIALWEMCLFFRIDQIEREHARFVVEYKGRELDRVIDFMNVRVPLARTFSPSVWAELWSSYSVFDESYANRKSFGFFIDVGNGFSTFIPGVLCIVAMTYDILPARAVGRVHPVANKLIDIDAEGLIVFAQDAQMAHEMGWCLQLIDHVEGSSLMRPEVESEQVQVVEPANSATMRLAA